VLTERKAADFAAGIFGREVEVCKLEKCGVCAFQIAPRDCSCLGCR
jgi:hypothetical protein